MQSERWHVVEDWWKKGDRIDRSEYKNGNLFGFGSLNFGDI